MRLPEVATRLRELASEVKCEELQKLANEISRRPITHRAPKQSASMNAEIRAKIRSIKRANPDIPHTVIGVMLNINPGRVSETLRGKRT